MVRTLDFHSSNVGSIPASLNIIYKKFNLYKKFNNQLSIKSSSKTYKVKYSLVFKSLIPLGTVKSIRLLLQFKPQNNKSKKLLVKQSYMLFTWLFYIEHNFATCKASTTPRFFIRPTIQTKFTQIKAPMAHKTFSQEQFIIKSYSLQISFVSDYSIPHHTLTSINQSVLMATTLRTIVPVLGTNLFFLKRVKCNFYAGGRDYLKLF